jgi:hypothetical protein
MQLFIGTNKIKTNGNKYIDTNAMVLITILALALLEILLSLK